MGAALTASGLRHVRGNRQVLTLDQLRVEPGARLAVLGPNGSGKTTLLRLLAGIEAPTEGTVALDDRPVDQLGHTARRMVAYVGQQPGLLTTSVRRNVELPLAWRRAPRIQRAARVSAALDRFGIAHLADRPAQRLSGGERQRVNLARALATEPSVLLLDEPAAALDAGARRAFLDDLDHALDGDPTTIVHVSHRPEEAMPNADLVAVLDSGQLRQIGRPVEVVLAPADATVARIVGYHNVLPAVVDTDGAIRFRGRDLGINGTTAAGLVTVAVWATGLVLGPPGGPGMPADVRTVTPGPGRWDVRLEGPPHLLAHLPYGAAPPHEGQPVAVALLPDHCAVIHRASSDQTTC